MVPFTKPKRNSLVVALALSSNTKAYNRPGQGTWRWPLRLVLMEHSAGSDKYPGLPSFLVILHAGCTWGQLILKALTESYI